VLPGLSSPVRLPKGKANRERQDRLIAKDTSKNELVLDKLINGCHTVNRRVQEIYSVL